MNTFVKFTGWNGSPFYVRKDLIAAVHTYKNIARKPNALASG